jgi:hypothetical protein
VTGYGTGRTGLPCPDGHYALFSLLLTATDGSFPCAEAAVVGGGGVYVKDEVQTAMFQLVQSDDCQAIKRKKVLNCSCSY